MASMALFNGIKVGSLLLAHRIAMSAMTRTRNDPTTEAPREINALYYEQRASKGGLIVTEGASPVPMGRGYIRQPNLFDESNIEGWKQVTSRVHAKGAYIFAQVMHAGRVSHPSLLPEGQSPVAPSAIKMNGMVHIKDGKAPYETPRALETEEIAGVVAGFAKAAENSIAAGFDGIELHGGNGYLLQEFLALPSNQRTDKYGGSVENRCRFVLEVVDACVEAIGRERVAIKLQQGLTFSDLVETEEDAKLQLAYLGPELAKRQLAYVCLSSLNGEPYFRFLGMDKPHFEDDIFRFFRKHYPAPNVLMINGGIAPDKAAEYVAEGTADLAAFGCLFLSNANLPDLLKAGHPELNMGGMNPSLWYGKDPADDAKGYTDWPLVEVKS